MSDFREFNNKIMQNLILFFFVLVLILLFELFIEWDFLVRLFTAINAYSLVKNIVSWFYILALLLFPWRPVRRLLWGTLVNIADYIISKFADLRKKIYIRLYKSPTKNKIFDVEEDINEYRKQVKTEDQHYTIRIDNDKF